MESCLYAGFFDRNSKQGPKLFLLRLLPGTLARYINVQVDNHQI